MRFWKYPFKTRAIIESFIMKGPFIIGESSGYPITKDFLKKMKAHWFKET
jgi:hypothetical protein